MNDAEYTKTAIKTILENIPKPGDRIDRKHTMKSVKIADYKAEDGTHITLIVETEEHPGIEFLYDKVIYSSGDKPLNPETEAIIFSSGFEESLLFHSKKIPSSGTVVI